MLGREAGQQPQIGFAEEAEHFESILCRPGGVIAELRPQILIEAHESDAREFNHLAITPTGGEFVFGEMSKDFENRPFLRSGAATECFAGDTRDQAKQSAVSGPLHFEWIFAGDVGSEALLVLFGRFCLRHAFGPKAILLPAMIHPNAGLKTENSRSLARPGLTDTMTKAARQMRTTE